MGSTPSIPNVNPNQNFQQLFDQSQGLYNQAEQSFQPPAALNDYVNTMMKTDYNKDYLSGTAGSSVEAANQAQGTTTAYDQYQQQYMKDLYGVGRGQANQNYRYDALNTNIDTQNAAAQAASSPWGFLGNVGGMAGGIALSHYLPMMMAGAM